MNVLRKTEYGRMIRAVLVLGMLIFIFPSWGRCASDTAAKVKKPVKASIDIRQQSQKKRDQWEQEKADLVLLYEQLKTEHETELLRNKDLSAQKTAKQALIQTLQKQKKESEKIQKELFPFLEEVYGRLDDLISNDVPFLHQERSVRLSALKKVMDDPEISIAEKYRKVMEAVFVEAEYGSTIEVYREKVQIENQEVLGDIFRLGRVSLFFLSLDKTSCGYFNVVPQTWLPLPETHLGAIRSAVDMGSKQRTVELLSLPLGKLAVEEDIQ